MAEVVYGCKLLVVTEIDPDTGLPPVSDPDTASIVTPQEVGVAPQFSEGQRQELRGGDRLLAVIEDDAELIGMDLTFTDAELDGEAMELIAGGSWEANKYTAPKIGAARTPFQTVLYVAQYEEAAQDASDVDGYIKFVFNYCKGRIPSFTARDRSFLVPQFTINCRENAAASLGVFTWEKVAELPS